MEKSVIAVLLGVLGAIATFAFTHPKTYRRLFLISLKTWIALFVAWAFFLWGFKTGYDRVKSGVFEIKAYEADRHYVERVWEVWKVGLALGAAFTFFGILVIVCAVMKSEGEGGSAESTKHST